MMSTISHSQLGITLIVYAVHYIIMASLEINTGSSP